MKIEKQVNGGTVTIIPEGWFDTKAAPEFEAVRMDIPDDVENMVIDCKSLEYISSSGIRQFVAAFKQMNGNLVLRNTSPEIMEVMDLTGVSNRIRIE